MYCLRGSRCHDIGPSIFVDPVGILTVHHPVPSILTALEFRSYVLIPAVVVTLHACDEVVRPAFVVQFPIRPVPVACPVTGGCRHLCTRCGLGAGKESSPVLVVIGVLAVDSGYIIPIGT